MSRRKRKPASRNNGGSQPSHSMAHREAPASPPVCPYCNEPSDLADSAEVYNGASYGLIYLCRPCWAYVGVHRGTRVPLGTLANAELRTWRRKVHAAFDPLWKEYRERKAVKKFVARNAAYAWLAERLEISAEECHVAMFGKTRCKLALRTIRDHADEFSNYEVKP